MRVAGCAEIPQAQSCFCIPTSSIPEKLSELAREFDELQLENYVLQEQIDYFRKNYVHKHKDFVPKASGRSDWSPMAEIARPDVEARKLRQPTQSLLDARLHETTRAGLAVDGLAGIRGLSHSAVSQLTASQSTVSQSTVSGSQPFASFGEFPPVLEGLATGDYHHSKSILSLDTIPDRSEAVDDDLSMALRGARGSDGDHAKHILHNYLDDHNVPRLPLGSLDQEKTNTSLTGGGHVASVVNTPLMDKTPSRYGAVTANGSLRKSSQTSANSATRFIPRVLSSVASSRSSESDDSKYSRFSKSKAQSWSSLPQWYDPLFKSSYADESKSKESLDWGCRQDSMMLEYWGKDNHGAKCALSPLSQKRVCWDICAVVMLLFEIWLTPFRFFFLAEMAAPPSLLLIQHVCTGFWSMDIVLNFFTGYVQKDQLILDCRRCARNYLHNWFVIDLIATIPYDLLIAAATGSEMTSTIRVTKVTKVVKTLRFLKMVRAMQIMYRMDQADRHNALFSKFKAILKPIQVLLGLCVLAHTNGCLFSTQVWAESDFETMDKAVDMYMYCFWWAYTGLTTGSIGSGTGVEAPDLLAIGGSTIGRWVFDMVLATQRMALIAVGIVWVAILSGSWVLETTHWHAQKRATTMYLQRHKVTNKTQVQVLWSLRETIKARELQRQFFELMSHELSQSLRRNICQELWTTRLLSLGLLRHVSDWHEDLIPELTLLVMEEVLAAKSVLFREGEVSSHGYCIFEGKLLVIATSGDVTFYKNMWVGEKALVNPQLRRSGTTMAKATSTLISVPGEGFHALLSRYGIMELFHKFVSEELWKGLCGRCGALGDHFTHQCPHMFHGLGAEEDPDDANWIKLTYLRTKSMFRAGMMKTSSLSSSSSTLPALANNLDNFLRAQERSWLTPFLQEMNVTTLDQLAHLDLTVLQSEVAAAGHSLTAEDQQAISKPVINKFVMAQQDNTQSVLIVAHREDHFLFLSHYKREAGTEASLMRSELERILQEGESPAPTNCKTPIFLDSEDLQNLKDLQQRVGRSHNLVLLLTSNVLTRPWVLVEVVTAIREGVRVVPVILQKGFDDFKLPDEDWYERMKSGKLLDQSGLKVLSECGIKAEDVCNVLRTVFQRIAVTYSPHRTEKIRRAELQALLKQCRTKRKAVKLSNTGTSSEDDLFDFASASSCSYSRGSAHYQMTPSTTSSQGKSALKRKGTAANLSKKSGAL